jgi:hypothetical protein
MRGYLGGIAAAAAFLLLAVHAVRSGGDLFVSRYELGAWLLQFLMLTVTGWIVALAPFAVTRMLVGPHGFATAPSAAMLGAIVACVTLLIVLWFARIYDAGRQWGSYETQLVRVVLGYGWLVIVSGAVFGLVYWAIGQAAERRLADAPQDGAESTDKRRGGWLRRHPAAASVAGLAVLAYAASRLWWPPHEPWWPLAPSSRTLPHFKLVRERSAELFATGAMNGGDITRTPAWSPDGPVVAVATLRSPVVWNFEKDRVETIAAGSGMDGASPAFISDHQILVAGGSAPDTAFSAVDIYTDTVEHEEEGPHPGDGQERNRPMGLAVSPDHAVAAVSFVDRQPQPAVYQTIFYRTRDWSRIRVQEDPGQFLAFVGDGARFAISAEHGQVIAIYETESGNLLTRIPIVAYGPPAFDRDGSLGAVAGGLGIRVFKVADGQEIAFYPFASGQGRSGAGTPVAWDPLGRFVAFQDRTHVHFWNYGAKDTKTIDERAIEVRRGPAGVAVSPDGNRVAVVNGNVVSIFAIGGGP